MSLVPPRRHKRHPRGPAPPVRLGAEGRFHKLFRRAAGWCGLAPSSHRTCPGKAESRSPCHPRRRGMFSSEPGAGPWTRFPQVLLGSSPGKGYSGAAEPSAQGTFRSRATLPEGPLRRLHTARGDLWRSLRLPRVWGSSLTGLALTLQEKKEREIEKEKERKKTRKSGGDGRWQRSLASVWNLSFDFLIPRTVVMEGELVRGACQRL